MKTNIELDKEMVKTLSEIPAGYCPKSGQEPEELYKFFTNLFAGSELAKYFNDKAPNVYLNWKTDIANGFFLGLRTGFNADQYLSFVVRDNTIISYYEYYLSNYCGYKCYCSPDGIIHEDIGYGFGSWKYKAYSPEGDELSSNSKQEYGSCCD